MKVGLGFRPMREIGLASSGPDPLKHLARSEGLKPSTFLTSLRLAGAVLQVQTFCAV